MEICELKRGDEKAWDEYVYKSNSSTFYHQIGWKNVVERTYGHRPCYLIAKEKDEIRGVLPLFLMKSKIFGSKLVSVPFAPYGGVCADDEKVEKSIVGEAKRLTEEFDVDYLEVRYLYPKNDSSFVTKSFYVTSVLELDPDQEVVWEKLKKDKRKMILRSEKQGLTSEWTDKIDGFYRLFARNMRDLGSPVHSKEFFESILREFPNNSKIFEVKRDDEVIYAAFYLVYRDRMINSWSSTLREYRIYLPTDFGIWNAIKYGCRNGFRYYDFGRSQLNSSNFEFKRRWGTQALPLYYLYYLNGSDRVPDFTSANPKRQKFAKIWSKMPVTLTRIVGPSLRKGIP